MYLFVLCPPRSGSTVLWRLLATSSSVSALPTEGQFIPEVSEAMRAEPWNPDAPIHWPYVKGVWDAHWDLSKPLLLEKSPPNLIRTDQIVRHFSPAAFVIMVRNPYAHTEGLLRRRHFVDVREAAAFSRNCLSWQAENAEKLDGSVRLTYEELTSNPQHAADRLRGAIPNLGALDVRSTFSVQSIDGVVTRSITDLNSRQIRRLPARYVAAISEVLRDRPDVMEYWGYDYLDPSPAHIVSFWAGKALRGARAAGRKLARVKRGRHPK